MMDPSGMFPDGYHPVKTDRALDFKGRAKMFSRAQRPPKYYWIDFGISRQYDPSKGPPVDLPILGGDKTVPEFNTDKGDDIEYNPFPTDIYYVGNLIREQFLTVRAGFMFFKPCIEQLS
jgi:hypothetical protein